MGSVIYVLMKWVGLRTEVNPLTGSVHVDERFAGASLADRAALETALQFAQLTKHPVHVMCLGPSDAEPMLRDAIACGASAATLFVCTAEQPTSDAVAQCLARHCTDASMVFCGDWSLDRGSGSVPSLVSHYCGIGQACGLVRVRINESSIVGQGSPTIDGERRLDGGRREVVRISGPAVLSVEGSVATLRRATIAGVLGAKSVSINRETFAGTTSQKGVRLVRVEAHRPPPPNLATNNSIDPRHRVNHILGVGVERTPPIRLTLGPDEAASMILQQLEAWSPER